MRQQAKQSPIISIKQAARLLNYSEGHVYRLVYEGCIPAKQRAKHCPLRFDREVIMQLKDRWGR